MNWLIFSIIATISFTIYDLLSKRLSLDSDNPNALAAIYNILLAVFSVFAFFIISGPIITKPISILLIGIVVIGFMIWAIFGKFEYLARKHTDLSTFLLIIKLAPIITLILSILFLGENLSWIKVIGVILTICANLIILKVNNFKINKGIIYSLIAAISIGAAWTFDKAISQYFNPAIYSVLVSIACAISNISFPQIRLSELKLELNKISLKSVALLALINTIGYISLIYAFSTGEASKIVLIMSSSTVFAVLIGIILFKEKDRILQKIVATALVVFATALLGR